jgi:hypothetical protein
MTKRIAAMLAAALPAAAAAQPAPVWSTVDCARSRIAPLAEAACGSTGPGSFGDVAGGPGQRHVVRGITPEGYVAITLSEGAESGAYVLSRLDPVGYLKIVDRRAADGSEWAQGTARDGAAYHTFRSSVGEACVGFRKVGERRSLGYAWMMHALLCAPAGRLLEPEGIERFLAAARVR